MFSYRIDIFVHGRNRSLSRSPSALRRLPAVAKEPVKATFGLVPLKRRAIVEASRNPRGDVRSAYFAENCATRFYFSNGRGVIRSARRLTIYSPADDRHLWSQIDFRLCVVTNRGLRCSSKASLRPRRAQNRACRKFPDCNNLFFGCFRIVSHKLTPT